MSNITLILLFIIFIIILYIFLDKILVNIRGRNKDSLLNNMYFNIDSSNINRWNYKNKNFAPYIDGSYKQVTNNYIPNYTGSFDDFNIPEDNTINDSRVNIWKNKNNSKEFIVQCK